MPRAVLVPATAADFAELAAQSDRTPRAPPVRTIAIAGKVDGRTIAIGGVAFWPNGVRHAFADIGPEARSYPVTLHKAALATIDLARRHKIGQLVAVADEPKEAAVRWLVRLGFRPVETGGETSFVLDL